MMSNNFKAKPNDKICRICFQQEKVKISLSCAYAEEKNLVPRIEKYFQIRVNDQSMGPRYICYKCLNNLDLIEKWVTTAQNKQKNCVDTRNSENVFEDDSLQTPTESNEMDLNNNNNKFGSKASSSGMNIFSDTDSQQLFLPKSLKKSCKNFPFEKPDYQPSRKKVKISENSFDMSETLIKTEIMDEDDKPKNGTSNGIHRKLKLIKNFERSFETLKRSK